VFEDDSQHYSELFVFGRDAMQLIAVQSGCIGAISRLQVALGACQPCRISTITHIAEWNALNVGRALRW
jgi:hypothetical protein